MNKNYFILFIVLISLVGSIYAAPPPFLQSSGVTFTEGYVVDVPLFESYQQNEDLELTFHVYNISTGHLVDSQLASCYAHIFNKTGHILFESEAVGFHEGLKLTMGKGNTSSYSGAYSWSLHCNNSRIGGYGSWNFEITPTGEQNKDDTSPLVAIILLPMLLSFIFLVGAVSLDKEMHGTMKIGLFLLSPIPFFTSMHFGVLTLVEYYGFTALQSAITSNVYWYALCLFAIISYFIIYSIKVMFDHASQRHQEKLEY